MKFGLLSGALAGRTASHDSLPYEQFIEYVKHADRVGMESVFLVEHHFTGYGQLSSTLTMLAFLAAQTKRIRLGTAVMVLPWHNPVILAETAATLDVLSEGRFDFGVGRGYRPEEFAGFDIAPAEADERFEEAMTIIRKAFTSDERFSHASKRWRYNDIVVEPSPLQKPHPPFWMAAGRDESIRKAARGGFNLLIDHYCTIDMAIDRVALFRSECEAAGRPYSPMMVAVSRAIDIVRSEEERTAAFNRRVATLRIGSGLSGGLRNDLCPKAVASGAVDKTALEGTRLDMTSFLSTLEYEDAALIGSPEEIGERLRRLESGGVEYVIFTQQVPNVASLTDFAENIRPAFSGPADKRGLVDSLERQAV